ncbi:hypothetical protein NC651_003184 [Populus alba x Populus x berolinensis]|nr:hypothetical protein NC651_003184 [Populus alba x Populus x berolinensis]
MMTLKSSFEELKLPRDMLDIEKHLQINRMMPASNIAKRREAAQVKGIFLEKKIKDKKRGIRKIHNLTCPHLLELFENLNS